MTWQSIINGATGIQYFVRQGLNYFPKSVATWGECGRIAVEVAELTPWLLSDEEPLPVESNSKNVLVTSRVHNGQLIIMAVNRINEPVSTSFRVTGINNGKVRVLFENRLVPVKCGIISDQLAPFGSQVYLVSIKPEKGLQKLQTRTLSGTPVLKISLPRDFLQLVMYVRAVTGEQHIFLTPEIFLKAIIL
jgi:hypothetical protein